MKFADLLQSVNPLANVTKFGCEISIIMVMVMLTCKITQPFFPFSRGAEISVELWSTYLEIPDKALRTVEISETCSEI